LINSPGDGTRASAGAWHAVIFGLWACPHEQASAVIRAPGFDRLLDVKIDKIKLFNSANVHRKIWNFCNFCISSLLIRVHLQNIRILKVWIQNVCDEHAMYLEGMELKTSLIQISHCKKSGFQSYVTIKWSKCPTL
jgi:hypothetical protein